MGLCQARINGMCHAGAWTGEVKVYGDAVAAPSASGQAGLTAELAANVVDLTAQLVAPSASSGQAGVTAEPAAGPTPFVPQHQRCQVLVVSMGTKNNVSCLPAMGCG